MTAETIAVGRPGRTGATQFPPGFVWGAAAAAYQVEGAAAEDGRGPSIWDTFSHQPGRILDGGTGDVATDHYHRVTEDLDLMSSLGLGAYRFSVSWTRVLPTGSGRINQVGLDFYSRLVDGLLERNIAPYLTLFHWDLPQALQDAGGWLNRDTAARFADYCGIIGAALGDRVGTFTTLNEPWCPAFLGHASGVHAPGITDPVSSLKAAHHLNLAHGLGASAVRAAAPGAVDIAITWNLAYLRPASGDPVDVDAVRAADAVSNRIFTDPVLNGHYPPDLFADTAHVTDWSFVLDGDTALIHQVPDVIGVNYYSPTLVAGRRPGDGAVPAHVVNDPQAASSPTLWPGTDLACALPQPGPFTEMGWRIDPGGLTELLLRMHRDAPGTPLMVTENGAAYSDVVLTDGSIRDSARIRYLDGHLRAVLAAIEVGADVRGYFVWSLVDNFEWAWGYTKRFGIVHVDFDNLARTPKDSARWYQQVIRDNGLEE